MIWNINCGDQALRNDEIIQEKITNSIIEFFKTSYSIHLNLLELDSMEIIGLLGTIEAKNNLEIDLSSFDGNHHLASTEELVKYVVKNGKMT